MSSKAFAKRPRLKTTESVKLQIPSSKLQRNSKPQRSNREFAKTPRKVSPVAARQSRQPAWSHAASALSPWERENRFQRLGKSVRIGPFKSRHPIVPLPKGEGRGEGKKSRHKS